MAHRAPLATCTVWVAVDDSTEENGCLRVIPGSHHERQLRAHEKADDPMNKLALKQQLLGSEFDEGKVASVVLRAGQVSLHWCTAASPTSPTSPAGA